MKSRAILQEREGGRSPRFATSRVAKERKARVKMGGCRGSSHSGGHVEEMGNDSEEDILEIRPLIVCRSRCLVENISCMSAEVHSLPATTLIQKSCSSRLRNFDRVVEVYRRDHALSAPA